MKKRMYKLLSLLLATVITATSVNVDAFAKPQEEKAIANEDEIRKEEESEEELVEEVLEDEDLEVAKENRKKESEDSAAYELSEKEASEMVEDEILPEEAIEEESESYDGIKPGYEPEDYSGYRTLEDEWKVADPHEYADDVEVIEEVTEADFDRYYITPNLPPLRNQNPYGTCWAHSSLALAEINLMKKGKEINPDYSELHLSFFTYEGTQVDPLGGTAGDTGMGVYTDDSPNFADNGGNYTFASRRLSAWVGADSEDYDSALAYRNISKAIPKELDQKFMYETEAAKLVGVRKIPSDDRALMKKNILEYGALGMDYYSLSASKYISWRNSDGNTVTVYGNEVYSEENNCYYFYENYPKTNHAVTIVGWDDDFPRTNFVHAAPKNGAWRVRNSWTTNDNEESYSGYFWMSYYDYTLLSKPVYAFEFELSDAYDNNYIYDGALVTSSSGYPDETDAANVFEASACTAGETLKAVSFWTALSNLDYTVKIYKNLKTDGGIVTDPLNGTYVSGATVSGTTEEEGFYTVDLANTVDLSYGELYSVVIEFKKSGQSVYVPYEVNSNGSFYKTTAACKPGQSMYRHPNNSSWTDLATGGRGNLCIRALTDNKTAFIGKKVTVSYDLDGGSCGVSSNEQTVGNKYSNLPIPVKDRYRFLGWFDSKVDGKK